MTRTPVESSNIASIGYDAEHQTLEIEFQSGDVWDYLNVAPEEHAALMAAESKGKYFRANIRNQYYQMKVEEGKP